MSVFRDRIKDLRRVPARDLRPSPRNWRNHPPAQRAAIEAMLGRVGIADAAIARELPDGSLELIDGHLRADMLGDELIPVLVLDVDQAEADQLLATLDPLAGMAETDGEKLNALLAGFVGGDGIDELLRTMRPGTGVIEVPPPDIPRGDRSEFSQMTFLLDAGQAESVRIAISSATEGGGGNRNGAALARIAEWWNERGQ